MWGTAKLFKLLPFYRHTDQHQEIVSTDLETNGHQKVAIVINAEAKAIWQQGAMSLRDAEGADDQVTLPDSVIDLHKAQRL